MYAFMALSTSCSFKKFTGRDQPWMYFAIGAVGGSMLIIETPGRHMGMYQTNHELCNEMLTFEL